MSTLAKNLLRLSPRVVPAAALLVFLISSQIIAARFIGYFIVAELLSWFLKKLLGVTFPNSALVHRPEDGGNCTGCGVFPKHATDCISVADQIGMPSGHALTMAMSATFWCMWIWYNGAGNTASKAIRMSLLVLLALAVIISRTALVENCHTALQVTVGSLLGVGMGIGCWYLDVFLVNKYSIAPTVA